MSVTIETREPIAAPQTGWLARASRGYDRIAIALAIYVVARAIAGPVLWPCALIEPVLPWLLLPSAIAAAPAWIARRRIPGIAHALNSVAWIAWLAASWARPAPPVAYGPTVAVMTYNVASGLARIEPLLAVFRASGADVIVLQELDDEEADELAARLLDEYPHRVLHGLGVPGKGVLSKFPILEHDLFRLRSERPYLRVSLDVRGERWELVDVHIPLEQVLLGPFGSAEDDVRELASKTMSRPRSLLVGDFNATPSMRVADLIASAGLIDAFGRAGRGLGFTFPIFPRYRFVPLPRFVRIDHVWHTPDLICVEASVAPDGGSDHRPVLARLAAGPTRPDSGN